MVKNTFFDAEKKRIETEKQKLHWNIRYKHWSEYNSWMILVYGSSFNAFVVSRCDQIWFQYQNKMSLF